MDSVLIFIDFGILGISKEKILQMYKNIKNIRM